MIQGRIQFTEQDLHIAHGGSPEASLRHCLKLPSERILVSWDNLSSGPLMSVDDPDSWKQLRRDFWNAEGLPEADSLPDPSSLYSQLIAERESVRAAEHIFLWLGTTLTEQILQAWLVVVLRHLEIATEGLRFLQLLSHQGKIVHSIGILNCEQIEQLSRWRRPAEEELQSYEAAWHAVSGSSPEGLIAFCAPESQHPAPLKAALDAFMARYPAVDTGVNYWDRLILANCREHGQKAARIIGHTMVHDVRCPDWPGDLYLFDRLKRLGDSRLAHPLLALTGNLSAIRFVEAAITETGERVLAGEANHAALNGVDDWIGGVRLNARAGSPWLFDGKTLVPGGRA